MACVMVFVFDGQLAPEWAGLVAGLACVLDGRLVLEWAALAVEWVET